MFVLPSQYLSNYLVSSITKLTTSCNSSSICLKKVWHILLRCRNPDNIHLLYHKYDSLYFILYICIFFTVKGQRDRDGSSESRSFKEKQLAAPTPMGVNRRTTVLFTNKSLCKTAAQSAGSTSSGNSTPEHNSASRRRRPGRPARPKPHGIESAKPIDSLAKKTDSAITLKHQNVEKVHESPGPSTRKRSSSTTTSNITESLSADLPSKRSSSLSDPPLLPSGPSLDTGSLFSDAQKKESFTQYRSTGGLISDIDTASESGSSDSSLSDSDSSKQSSSDSADGEMAHRYSRRGAYLIFTTFI